MKNNKGFAVSAVLYTLLVAFLLYLAVNLSLFNFSAKLMNKANNDLINGDKFEASFVRTEDACNDNKSWFDNNILVKINSKYGTYYWPRDFGTSATAGGTIEESTSTDGKIEQKGTGLNIRFRDAKNAGYYSDVELYDFCQQ